MNQEHLVRSHVACDLYFHLNYTLLLVYFIFIFYVISIIGALQLDLGLSGSQAQGHSNYKSHIHRKKALV